MRFAVVGDLSETISIVEAIQQSRSHTIASVYAESALRDEIAAGNLTVQVVASVEEAVVDQSADSVVVGFADSDASIRAARQASQNGLHVVAIPPLDVSPAYSFELHLLLDESELGIIPLLGRWYVDDPQHHMTAAKEAQQIHMEYPLPQLDAATLKRAMLHGVDALSSWGFAYDRVTALDVQSSADALLSRSVTLASAELPEAPMPPATLQLRRGDHSSAPVMEFRRPGQQAAQAHIRLPSVASSTVQPELLNRLTAALPSAERCSYFMEQFSATLELMEGIATSLRRRRTIDVHYDGNTERGAFKTTMTAMGCGVLTYAMFGMIAYLVIAQLTHADEPSQTHRLLLNLARIVWIAPVVLFLLAQFLLPLARDRSHRK